MMGEGLIYDIAESDIACEPFEIPDHWRRVCAGKENGTSIFDPVVCELAYTWFAPVGGVVLDPFAGGSVRGWGVGEY